MKASKGMTIFAETGNNVVLVRELQRQQQTMGSVSDIVESTGPRILLLVTIQQTLCKSSIWFEEK